MDDIWLLAGGFLLVLAQIACLFAKKVWVRLIPAFIAVTLMAFCVIMYVLSGFTNWAYLILLLLLAGVQCAMGMAWLVYGIIYMVRKVQ